MACGVKSIVPQQNWGIGFFNASGVVRPKQRSGTSRKSANFVVMNVVLMG